MARTLPNMFEQPFAALLLGITLVTWSILVFRRQPGQPWVAYEPRRDRFLGAWWMCSSPSACWSCFPPWPWPSWARFLRKSPAPA